MMLPPVVICPMADAYAAMTRPLAIPVVKGGPGSGHWGHAGRPGTVGGSATGGAVASADVMAVAARHTTVFHATTQDVIESIRTNGIRAYSSVLDEYGEEIESGGAVFFSTESSEALYYADISMGMWSGNVAMVEFEVDLDAARPDKHDASVLGSKASYYVMGDIPPTAIKRIQVYSVHDRGTPGTFTTTSGIGNPGAYGFKLLDTIDLQVGGKAQLVSAYHVFLIVGENRA